MLFNMTMRAQLKLLEVVKGCTLGAMRQLSVTTQLYDKPTFNWQDPFITESQYTQDEIMVRDQVRAYCQKELQPKILEAFRNESFDKRIMKAFGDIGIIGCTLPNFSPAPVSHVALGLIAKEIESIDSGHRSTWAVQNLIAYGISSWGSEEQKEKYLTKLMSGDYIGCFGLTEPNHGSDPGSLETRAIYDANKKVYKLRGSKTWITNSPVADVLLVWAKCDDDKICGFIIERKGNEGVLSTPAIKGKVSLRASTTGMILMDDVTVPEANMLPGVAGLKGPFECLNRARYGISWGALGVAEECLKLSNTYVLDRKQFKKPLAANQLIQKKLADMMVEIAIGYQACIRVGRLMNEKKATPEMISMIKKNSVAKALNIARVARDILGANGISDEYHIIRHMVNLEAVFTYEGTDDIHNLILGRAITGIAAF
ncbi:hypothetical protein PV327_005653 [Microctonus hyperodae]|uniref:Glutaryl-CoA dehydrogenase n=2 Tax=Microctonus hyperodae TaxID=165561 RepID=A0AA39G2N3_MICHY|nr:hypothetical protein PV327_005653 [Microctonus hyperodae]